MTRKKDAACLCTCHSPDWGTRHMGEPCCDDAVMYEPEEGDDE